MVLLYHVSSVIEVKGAEEACSLSESKHSFSILSLSVPTCSLARTHIHLHTQTHTHPHTHTRTHTHSLTHSLTHSYTRSHTHPHHLSTLLQEVSSCLYCKRCVCVYTTACVCGSVCVCQVSVQYMSVCPLSAVGGSAGHGGFQAAASLPPVRSPLVSAGSCQPSAHTDSMYRTHPERTLDPGKQLAPTVPMVQGGWRGRRGRWGEGAAWRD